MASLQAKCKLGWTCHDLGHDAGLLERLEKEVEDAGDGDDEDELHAEQRQRLLQWAASLEDVPPGARGLRDHVAVDAVVHRPCVSAGAEYCPAPLSSSGCVFHGGLRGGVEMELETEKGRGMNDMSKKF